MHERHSNREQYFEEQSTVTKKYVIPFIENVRPVTSSLVVAEIGCGEAGNLKPFLDMGCTVVGIDLAPNKIENGKKFYANHPNKNKITLIAEDIYKIDPNAFPKFDLIVMRDVIEHIPNQDVFMGRLKDFLAPDGIIFFAYPPWRMPFGGHQQICINKFMSKMPYTHLLPRWLYFGMMRWLGESKEKIVSLTEVRDTGISINTFNGLVKKHNYVFKKQVYYFINPNYEVKFKLKPRVLSPLVNIPWLRDFFVTTYYNIIALK
ncbi:MAG: class I SAM-dependent methyltransferase [Bacteroidia bacterium]